MAWYVFERLLVDGRSGGELDIRLMVRVETPDCPTGVLGRSPLRRDGGRRVDVRAGMLLLREEVELLRFVS